MGKDGGPSGSKGKGGSGRNEDSAQGAADTLAALSADLYGKTDPLRQNTIGILNNVLAGGRPSAMAFTGPEREAIEGQFNNARENIIENTPARGGQMNQLLGQAEIGRAQAVSGLDAEIRRAALQGALQAGFGAPGPAFQGLSGAGNIFSGLNQTQSGNSQAKKSSTGSIIGLAAAAAAFSCWIAAAIYGEDSDEFLLARWWIFGHWQGATADLTRFVYRLVGPTVAPYVKRWRWLRRLLKPLFDVAVKRAILAGAIV